MIELKITGNNFAEIRSQLFDVVKDIDKGAPVETVHTIDTHLGEVKTPVNSFDVNPETFPSEETKKKRRTKAEVEADKAASLAKAQAEVEAAKASHAPAAPIVIPPTPTTNHVVNIPAEVSMVQQPEAPAEPVVNVAPPLQATPTNAYTLQTFKANLIPIINALLISGALSSKWIGDTSKEVFGGADLWLWSQNETKIEELFNSFIEWNLIQKLQG